jgi:hypothetical protein
MSTKKSALDAIAEEIAENDGNISMADLEVRVTQKRAELTMNDLQVRQTAFLEKVRKEPRVAISVAPQYASEFSKNMRVVINGVSIFIPIDGREYMVPETFASEIKRRIHKVNQKINRLRRKGTTENFNLIEEKSIGEVKLF